MRRMLIAALLAPAALASCDDDRDPAPLVQDTCLLPDAGQCAVYTLPADWPVDVRANCESSGGTWGAACPEPGRVGTCTCLGAGGASTVVFYSAPVWTAGSASASCADLPPCTWSAP